jgi:hypothetical protein
MQIRVERFLAITAMLAGTALAAGGCVTEEETDATGGSSGSGGSSASGGSAGSTGGSAGSTGGSAGSTGGSAGSTGGSAGSAGDAGTECLGDTPSDPDAGVEGICSTLPYAGTTCPDAGVEGGGIPTGVSLCDYMAVNGRLGVLEAMVTCLAAISGDACTAAHDTGVQACVDSIFPQACETGPLPLDDGGTYDLCQDVADSCPASDAGTGGISKEQCLDSISPFTPAGQLSIAECYNTVVGTCEDDFTACVFAF